MLILSLTSDGGAPARLCAGLELTEHRQRALGEAVGCWGGGGAVAVMEKRLGQPVTGNGDGGEQRCCCGRCQRRRRRRNAKMEARLSAGWCWGDNAMLRRVVACAVRATAMRGHRGLHTTAMSWRWSATEDSQFSRFSSREEPPDSAFSKRFNR